MLLLTLGAADATAQIYTVAVNHAPPYRIVESKDGRTEISGFYVDVIREAARRIGVELRFEVVPFKRALLLVQRGGADIVLGPNRTPEREAYLDYLNVEISRERKIFYLREDTSDIVDYDDLAGRRIAVLRGAIYFDRFDADPTLEKPAVSDYETGIRVLERGRVDTLIMPELQGDYLLREVGRSLRKSSFSVEGRPSFIAISRKSTVQQSRAVLLQELRDMKSQGVIADIISRYR